MFCLCLSTFFYAFVENMVKGKKTVSTGIEILSSVQAIINKCVRYRNCFDILWCLYIVTKLIKIMLYCWVVIFCWL